MNMARSSSTRKLRKQPKMRRAEAVWTAGRPLSVPATAQKRRQRNNQRLRLPIEGLKQLVLSTRWVSLTLLAISIYALLLIGQDEGFYLTVIPVEGAVAIPAREIVEVSGLGGRHIFAADPGAAAAAIARSPGVVSATVELHWPNQVAISISEDSPIAIWEQAGERYWVNGHGRLSPARLDLPGLLHIYSEQPEPVDEIGFVSQDVLYGALQLIELRSNIDKLYYRPSGGLSYQDGRGWRVYFGDGTDMAQKLVVYETIVEDLLARGITPVYISVSNQAKPYYLAN